MEPPPPAPPGQSVCEGRQLAAHWPPWQLSPAGHWIPQPPQFRLSLSGVTQRVPPLHARVPLPQRVAQEPAEQTWPAGQERPQPPQFWLSELRFTHTPPQTVEPAGQTTVHTCEMQLFPAAQTWSQAPQFAGSLAIFVQ